MVRDRKGNKVQVGSKVKITYTDPKFLASLPENERKDVTSMLDEVLEVYEIDEYGQAWVEKEWDRGNGVYESHSLALLPSEMEIVKDSS